VGKSITGALIEVVGDSGITKPRPVQHIYCTKGLKHFKRTVSNFNNSSNSVQSSSAANYAEILHAICRITVAGHFAHISVSLVTPLVGRVVGVLNMEV